MVAASALITGWMRRYALQRDLLDMPNARSSHSRPTPRGGGVSVVVVSLASTLLVFLAGWIPPSIVTSLAGGGVAVAAIGHLDDHRHVPARWRLLVHLLAALWVVGWLDGMEPISLPGFELQMGWAGAAIGVLWIAWLLNLYNFMDGIDGLAAVEAVTVSACAAALLFLAGATGLALLMVALSAAALGFLVWNWPPAKIFMGDAGSGYIGFVFGSMALISRALDALVLWAWLILLGVFLVDATMTLLHRLIRKERVYEPHCSHAYQRAARRYAAHRPVTVAVGLINLLWLFPLAWAATRWQEWGIALTIVAWAPLVVLAASLGAGNRENQLSSV